MKEFQIQLSSQWGMEKMKYICNNITNDMTTVF